MCLFICVSLLPETLKRIQVLNCLYVHDMFVCHVIFERDMTNTYLPEMGH